MRNIYNRVFKDKFVRNFINHNKVLFKKKNKYVEKKIVLIEFNDMQACHIPYSYFVNYFSTKFNYKIVAYNPLIQNDLSMRLKFYIKKIFNFDSFPIYKSFGTDSFLLPKIDSKFQILIKNKYKEYLKSIKTKKQLLKFKIDKIWIGDLIYDGYLRTFSEPTIDLKSKKFCDYFKFSLENFYFWKKYFSENEICAINVSHCIYLNALPLRIALGQNIPCFQFNIESGFRLSNEKKFAYTDFSDYPKNFLKIKKSEQLKGLKKAKERIEKRFKGEVGVDMHYSTKSAYTKNRYKNLIKKSNRKKILIAAHCFFDSPHGYGLNLFDDFCDWFDCLGRISEQTNYDWYIKTHPDVLPGNKEIIDNYLKKFHKFKLLPSDASHHQLIKEGIDVALTNYGTIGFEYAALGKIVINASVNNPHAAYDFNYNPKTKKEYLYLLKNLKNLNLKINIKKVYEYYYMRNIHNHNNIFLDYENLLNSVGYYNLFTSNVYQKWIDQFTSFNNKKIIKAIDKFISTKDFRINSVHLRD